VSSVTDILTIECYGCVVMTKSHSDWLRFFGTLDKWVALQLRLGRKFTIVNVSTLRGGSDVSDYRRANDESGKEVAIEYASSQDITYCEYDPSLKIPR